MILPDSLLTLFTISLMGSAFSITHQLVIRPHRKWCRQKRRETNATINSIRVRSNIREARYKEKDVNNS